MESIGVPEIRCGDLPGYTSKFLENIDHISEHIRSFEGIKTHIRIKTDSDSDDLIRASLALSDLTTLTLGGQGKATVLISKQPRPISIPLDLVKEHNLDLSKPFGSFALFQPIDPASIKLAKSLCSLVEDGSIIIRPDPLLMFKQGDKHWNTLHLIHGTNTKEWVVSSTSSLDGELPLQIETDGKIPLDLVMPFIKGMPWNEYRKVLLDSKDTLLNLRASLKAGIKAIDSEQSSTAMEFKRDVIGPQIEALDRHFRKTTEIHRIKVAGATIGSLSLSLSAFIAPGIAAPISGLLGAGGLGLLTKEYADYREKLHAMKENPYYLFWRAKHARRD